MSATLWLDTDSETTIDLGGTIPLYQAFAEMANVAGDDYLTKWPDLFAVISQTETQEDAPKDWLADMRMEAADFLSIHEGELSDNAKWVLAQLSTLTENAFCPTGKGGGVDPTCSPGSGGGADNYNQVTLAQRMNASKEYGKQVELAAKFNADGWREEAAKEGKTVTQLQKEALTHAQKYVDNADCYIRTPYRVVLNKILNDGRFKNQFETGKSKGSYGPEYRIDEEANLMGVPKDETDENRPIYGYLSAKGFGEDKATNSSSALHQYGSVEILLKESVKDRTTVTFGDSANNRARLAASPARDLRIESLMAQRPDYVKDDDDRARIKPSSGTDRFVHNGDYIEAQYHGGLSVHDIKEIRFRFDVEDKVAKKLDALGIKWSIVRNKFDEVMGWKKEGDAR